jgi:hypothetical protein
MGLIPSGKIALSGRQTPDFLLEGENLLVRGLIHPAIFWKAVAVLILAVILLIKAFNLGLFMLLVAGIMIVMATLTQRYLVLILTDKRVIIRAGIAYVELIEIRHSQIESVELSYTIPGQIFGYATVVVSGTGRRTVMVPYIENAVEFRKGLEEILMKRDELPPTS